MRNISDKCCRENQDKFYIQKLYPDLVPLLDTVEKCVTARQVTDHKNGACPLHAG
jgi:hypothetical protein